MDMSLCVPNLIFYKHMLSAESQRSESVFARNKSNERVEIYMGVRNVFAGPLTVSLSTHKRCRMHCPVLSIFYLKNRFEFIYHRAERKGE